MASRSDNKASAPVGTEAVLGLQKSQVDTPSLLVELDTFEANVRRMSDYCRENRIDWRPHSKAHKSPDIAHLLIEAGARGITCAKLGEAEVMAANGIVDILVANTIVTPTKLRRLTKLQHPGRVMVAVDDADVVRLTGEIASLEDATIPVLIDIDIGMNRTGVDPGVPALELARVAHSTPGVEVLGIMGYEGHVLSVDPPEEKERVCHQALSHLVEAKIRFEEDGIPVQIVSAGGTGCYRITAAYDGITEIQAGGGIFMDNMYQSDCFVDDLDLALTVLATVTSRHSGHIVTDAGFKTMSSTHAAPTPVGRNDIELRYLSAEHGVWDLKPGCSGPRIGDQVEFIVGYSDSTNFLHDHFLGMRNDRVEAVWELMARGKLT